MIIWRVWEINLAKFIDKILNGIEITGITKQYHKGLLLTIHYRMKDNKKEYDFTIKITDMCRKQIAYILNDIVKMNITAKDLKGL